MKKLAGTDRKDRKNPKAPKLECAVPTQLGELGPDGQKAWTAMAEIAGPGGMRVLTKADAFAMYLLCKAWDGYMAACREMSKEGAWYSASSETVVRDPDKMPAGSRGGPKLKVKSKLKKQRLMKHPLADLAGSERDFIMQVLPRFGLTPADRNRVSEVVEGGTVNPVMAVINGAKKRATA